ncbi:MAG: alpha/beta hydrolase [Chloroflexi bacterium]|nr:alpha/beta hydrolase [Chloroflexota bacterium]
MLAHGITDNGLCWTPVAKVLEGEYDVIMYDARGHGLSEKPETGYTWEVLAEDLAGLIDALGLDRPLVMGHSLGAATAMLLAARYPAKTRGIVLEDPPCSDQAIPPEALRARAETQRQEITARKAMSEEELLAYVRQRSPTWPEAELGPWVQAKKQVSPHVTALYGAPRPDWRQAVKAIRCPTLWLTADPALGAIVTPAVAQEIKRLMPTSEIVYVEGAGHCIHREQFDAAMEPVKRFLRRVAQG